MEEMNQFGIIYIYSYIFLYGNVTMKQSCITIVNKHKCLLKKKGQECKTNPIQGLVAVRGGKA
jgi:hypothetical protein